MAQLSNGTFAIDQVDYVTENGDLVVAAVAFAVSASGYSMEMKGVDLFRFEDGLIKEVWLFSERIDEEDRVWTAITCSPYSFDLRLGSSLNSHQK